MPEHAALARDPWHWLELLRVTSPPRPREKVLRQNEWTTCTDLPLGVRLKSTGACPYIQIFSFFLAVHLRSTCTSITHLEFIFVAGVKFGSRLFSRLCTRMPTAPLLA